VKEKAASRTALRIDAIAGGFVGVLALLVSTYNVYLQRQQVRAQVWPHVELSYSEVYSKEDPHFDFDVENTGVGPAIVRSIYVTVDGARVQRWGDVLDLARKRDPELMRALGGPGVAKEGLPYNHMGLARRVLPAGAHIRAISIVGVSEEHKEALHRLFDVARVSVCYCSTLGDCWVTGGEAVGECPRGGEEFYD
jgi:hypothetical protein